MYEKRGKVKFYSEDKGYGFIEPESGGQDVLVNASAVEGSGYTTLYKNTKVSYVEKSFNNKNQAFNIKLCK